MTTEYKISLDPATPEAQQEKTADASQNRVTNENIDSFDRQSALLASVQESQKHADAQAASAHTPEAFHYTNLQFNDLPGFARDTILALERQLSETAGESDRLEAELLRVTDQAVTIMLACDQAREQIKTLLAALKDASEGHFRSHKVLAAIASIENEEAKD